MAGGIRDGQCSANDELEGSRVAHIGQVFFPESLLAKVDKTAPYRSSTIARLSNDNDDEFLLTNVNGYSATSCKFFSLGPRYLTANPKLVKPSSETPE